MLRSPSYRSEIDGLRALAVIAVIINHFNGSLLPSGYLGVDIFFVISGYVITSSLNNRISTGLADLVQGFYIRRIKRLIPVLVVFVLVTSLFVCLFDPYPALSLNTGIASLFGLSNLYLWLQATDYFGAATQLNAFTHTWSLGVEEQFYLIFPGIGWVTGWARKSPSGHRNLIIGMAFLSALSLASFVVLYPRQQAAAFFLMPPRFWEIGAGCLIFLCQSPPGQEHPMPRMAPFLLTAGLVGTLFLPLANGRAATILMVLLTAAWIIQLRTDSPTRRGFSHPTLVWIGLISYSLYLWHWAVLVISRQTIGIHWWSFPFQAGLMVLLAMASYRWVETPFRREAWSRAEQRTVPYGLSAVLGAALLLLPLSRWYWSRFLYTGTKDAGQDRIARYLKPALTPLTAAEKSRKGNCTFSTQLLSKETLLDTYRRFCLTNADQPGPLIALVGDSHAEATFPIADALAKEGRNVFFMARLGCVFPGQGEANQGCYGQTKETAAFLIDNIRKRDGGVVIVDSFLQGHFGYEGHMRHQFQAHPSGDRRSVEMNLADYVKALVQLAKKLREVNGKLVIIGPKPDHEFYAAGREVFSARCSRQWFRPFEGRNCRGNQFGTTKAAILERTRSISKTLKSVAAKHDNVYFYDPLPWLCRDGANCQVFLGDQTLYGDSNHFSKLGAQHLLIDLRRFLHANGLLPAAQASTTLRL